MKMIKLMMMTLMMCFMTIGCTNNDVNSSNTGVNKVPSSGKLQVENGEGKSVEIDYTLLFGINDSITFTNLYDIADKVTRIAKSECMNERTFEPKSFQMFQHSGSDTLSVSYKFIAANSYGVEDNLTKIVLISLDSLKNKNYDFILKK